MWALLLSLMLRGEATSSPCSMCVDVLCVEMEWSGCYRELEANRGLGVE